jgi:hypothetical protein
MKKVIIDLVDENKIINEFEFDFYDILKQYSNKSINISQDILNIYIDNKVYEFKKVDKISTTSTFYQHNNLFLMKVPNDVNLVKKELQVYERLKNYSHFPKIIQSTNGYIIFEKVGEIINPHNIPNDALKQINEICKILQKEKIKHNDIRENEVLVKKGIIYLVDFNRAILDDENYNQNYNDLYYIVKKYNDLKNLFNKTIKKF